MAGRGFVPKDPDARARRNSDPIAMRVLARGVAKQPDRPTIAIEKDGKLAKFVWPAIMLEWWRMWPESPLSADFTSTDWSELRDTALLHARY